MQHVKAIITTYETPHLQHNKAINETSLMQHHLCNIWNTIYTTCESYNYNM